MRVLVADDHTLMRDTLAAAVDADPELEVAAMAASVDEAVELARAKPPDVAIVDVSLPGGGASRAATTLRALSGRPRVVALSSVHDDTLALATLRAGACCFIVKERAAAVIDAIRWAAQNSESGDRTPDVLFLDRFRAIGR